MERKNIDDVESDGNTVMGTSDDAAVSKLSATSLGYYQDDFLKYFVSGESRRAPLINRGYYARVAAVRQILKDFLTGAGNPKKQIVSLGAGFDTTYFVFKSQGIPFYKWFEVDFPQQMQKKGKLIQKHKPLLELVMKKKEGSGGGTDLQIVGADLRNVDDLEATLVKAGLDFTLPTLFLSECVLVYLKPEDSAKVIQWAAGKFTGGAVFVTYEQILPNDPFGKTMKENLESRGCSLLGLDAYPDLESQKERFLKLGWKRHDAWDMNDVYKYYLPVDELKRVEKIELFDEYEEWHLIQGHYCISMASLPPTSSSDSSSNSNDLSKVGLIGFVKKEPPQEKVDVEAIRAKFVLGKKSPSSSASTLTVAAEESKDISSPALLSPRRLEMNEPGHITGPKLRPSKKEPLNFASLSDDSGGDSGT